MYICPGLALTEKILKRVLGTELGEFLSFLIFKCFLEFRVSTGICIMEVSRVQILSREKNTVFCFKN